jgi:1-acyl-sn-glycerol-3-phosphate acyltransferase
MKIFKKIGRVIVRGAIYGYCKIVYRVKIFGKENIPKEGAVLFCGNHRNYLDPPLIVATAGRHMRFIAKEELSHNKFYALLGIIFDAIYVKRDSKDITAMKEALKTLKSGGCVGLFPEGTRNGLEKNDGQIKNGAAYMAIKTGAKIVPIGIVGKAKPFTKNAIIYGKPLDFSEYKALGKGSEDKASEVLRDEIVKLSSTEI